MRERQLLQRIAQRSQALAERYPHVLVGPGDDAAVIAPSPLPTVATCDQLVQGRHFDDALPVECIARKAVLRSASDAAAMAARPAWALATALLPARYEHADALFEHMKRWAEAFGCPLVGGDIATLPQGAGGPMVLTVTVVGHTPRPVLRSTAQPGDDLFVTGALGGSLASGRHALAHPRVQEACTLADLAPIRGMIDISDGLGIDAGRVAQASGVRLELHAQRIPVHPDATGLDAALRDGEDYELLFAAPPHAPIPARIGDTPITRIGRVVQGPPAAVLVMPDGTRRDVSSEGFEHG